MKKRLSILIVTMVMITGCGNVGEEDIPEATRRMKLDAARHVPADEIAAVENASVSPKPTETPEPLVPTCLGATGVQTSDYTAHFVGDEEYFVASYEDFTLVQKGSEVYFLSDTKKYKSTLDTRDILLNLQFGEEDLRELLSFYSHLEYDWLTGEDGALYYHDSLIEYVDERITSVGSYTVLYDEIELPDVEGCYSVDYFVIDDAIKEASE